MTRSAAHRDDAGVARGRGRVRFRAGPVLGTVLVLSAVAVASAVAWWMRASDPGPVSWSRIEAPDVHSVSFGDGADRLFFGSHAGVHRSDDGGRTWRRLSFGGDAMSLRVSGPDAQSIVAAGHGVLALSDDGGTTWRPMVSDLPDLDIHGFARDPGDPSRMWASLASGVIFESRDGGARWMDVFPGPRPFLTAFGTGAGLRLLAVDPAAGLALSADGGRTWQAVSDPGAYPVTTLAAGPDGRLLLVGTHAGLILSDDGGSTWRRLPFPDTPLASAVAPDGKTVVVVDEAGRVYRSPDGGRTWLGPSHG